MKFLLDIEIEPAEGAEITAEQFAEHLRSYQFDTEVSFELSLLADDPYHELGNAENYVIYSVKSATVEILEK